MAWWPLLPLWAMAVLAEALFKMGLGNRIGFKMMNNMTTHDMFKPMYGSIVLEMVSDAPAGELLGETTADYTFECCGDKLDMAQLQEIWESKLEPVYPYRKAGPAVEKIDGSPTAPLRPRSAWQSRRSSSRSSGYQLRVRHRPRLCPRRCGPRGAGHPQPDPR